MRFGDHWVGLGRVRVEVRDGQGSGIVPGVVQGRTAAGRGWATRIFIGISIEVREGGRKGLAMTQDAYKKEKVLSTGTGTFFVGHSKI